MGGELPDATARRAGPSDRDVDDDSTEPNGEVRLRLVGSVAVGAHLTDAFEAEGFVVTWIDGGIEDADARPDGKFVLDFLVCARRDSMTGELQTPTPGTTVASVLRLFSERYPNAQASAIL